jgi:hypothetical protein
MDHDCRSHGETPTIQLDGCGVQWVLWDGDKDAIVAVADHGIEAQADCNTGAIAKEDVLQSTSLSKIIASARVP